MQHYSTSTQVATCDHTADLCYGVPRPLARALSERLEDAHRLLGELVDDTRHRVGDLDALGQARLLVGLDDAVTALQREYDRLHNAYLRVCRNQGEPEGNLP